MVICIGWTVEYEGKDYEVLGFAASKDDKGQPMVEIAWLDYSVSPTGYLAVDRDQLKVKDTKIKFDTKPPGKYEKE